MPVRAAESFGVSMPTCCLGAKVLFGYFSAIFAATIFFDAQLICSPHFAASVFCELASSWMALALVRVLANAHPLAPTSFNTKTLASGTPSESTVERVIACGSATSRWRASSNQSRNRATRIVRHVIKV